MALAPSTGSSSADSSAGSSKDELFWKILNSALRLECTKGHLRWKMTDLSRASGVTRSLIYYYFGNSKINIVQAGIRILGEEFFGLSDERQALWKNGEIWESVRLTRLLVKQAPDIPVFYLTQRQNGSQISREILELERRYVEKLKTHLPGISEDKLRIVFSSLYGIVTLEDFSDETLKTFVSSLIRSLR